MRNLSLRLNKPLQPRDASSMSKALSFSGSNEPAVATGRSRAASSSRRLFRRSTASLCYDPDAPTCSREHPYFNNHTHRSSHRKLTDRKRGAGNERIFGIKLKSGSFRTGSVTAKLFVPAGAPDYFRCGDLLPPAQPKPKLSDRIKSFGR